MRKQIAAANWKMNLSLKEGITLLEKLAGEDYGLKAYQEVIIAVPFPYLIQSREIVKDQPLFHIAAQNCHTEAAGAYTGEVSAAMLASCGITHVIIGHSERRMYFSEDDQMLARKTDMALAEDLTPIFCCGESLDIRERGEQNSYVASQIEKSLFHLSTGQMQKLVLAYEPIWAIGTGKTATAEQAQEMHNGIRSTISEKYGEETAQMVPILYGGSVKPNNANEIFGKPDVDGGLVGGASLKADDFAAIIKSLK